jgi:hypothetical protein
MSRRLEIEITPAVIASRSSPPAGRRGLSLPPLGKRARAPSTALDQRRHAYAKGAIGALDAIDDNGDGMIYSVHIRA